MKGTGSEFIERTKYRYLPHSDQMMGVRPPPLELAHENGAATVELPNPRTLNVGRLDLRDAIEGRTSVRDYSREPLTLEELSYLLWCTQGVKQVVPRAGTFRTVPSAGARHALETYVLANNVTGLRPGLYRFLAVAHRLVELTTRADIAARVARACLGQELVTESAASLIWAAVPYRMTWRYSERGYRYLFLDAGHACQNLYLSAQSLGCGVCAVAAFSDDELNGLLGLDGENQFAIYTAAIGKR